MEFGGPPPPTAPSPLAFSSFLILGYLRESCPSKLRSRDIRFPKYMSSITSTQPSALCKPYRIPVREEPVQSQVLSLVSSLSTQHKGPP